MNQPGFFGLENRYAGLDAHGDPLMAINAAVPFEMFRLRLKTALIKGGRGGATVRHVRRLPQGQRPPGPPASPLAGSRDRGGQIIDVTIVAAPRQRNSREDNAMVKAGKTPEQWEKQPAKIRQKDKDARWTKSHGHSDFGYNYHVCIDRRHKLVRRYGVTSASVHDSQKLADLIDTTNTATTVWADSAYCSKEAEEKLAAREFKSRIHRWGCRGKPLTARQEAANKTRSSVRARVEHVFGCQHTSMGGKLVRTIGIVRARIAPNIRDRGLNRPDHGGNTPNQAAE